MGPRLDNENSQGTDMLVPKKQMTKSLQLYEQASTVATTLESQMDGTVKMEQHQNLSNCFAASNHLDSRRLITPKKLEADPSGIDIRESDNDVDLNCDESY